DELFNMEWGWLGEDLDNGVVNGVFLNVVLNAVVRDMDVRNELFWIEVESGCGWEKRVFWMKEFGLLWWG
ncbi:hypothetical protein, partial [Bacillus altitudinis]|uniref:hypothetical protein n=1 Tax=Bacillus altitudinis TaxID=293387 RepID=UPI001C92F934